MSLIGAPDRLNQGVVESVLVPQNQLLESGVIPLEGEIDQLYVT